VHLGATIISGIPIEVAVSVDGGFQCSGADCIRDMLEELMDDDDEVCKLNLSSRPSREERRRLRERERLERGMERCGWAPALSLNPSSFACW
jgi:hypothetical protein